MRRRNQPKRGTTTLTKDRLNGCLFFCRKKLEATIFLTTLAAVTGAPTKEAGAIEATAWSRRTTPITALTVVCPRPQAKGVTIRKALGDGLLRGAATEEVEDFSWLQINQMSGGGLPLS